MIDGGVYIRAGPVEREAVRNFVRLVIALETRRGDAEPRVKSLTSSVHDIFNKKQPARYFVSQHMASETKAFVISAVRAFQPTDSPAQYVYYCRPDLCWGMTPYAVDDQIRNIKLGHATTEAIRRQLTRELKAVEQEWTSIQHGKSTCTICAPLFHSYVCSA